MKQIILTILFFIPFLSNAQEAKSSLFEESKIVMEGLTIENIQEDVIGYCVLPKNHPEISWCFKNKSEFIDAKIISEPKMLREINQWVIFWEVEVSFLLQGKEDKWIIQNARLEYEYSSYTKNNRIFMVRADKMEKTTLSKLDNFKVNNYSIGVMIGDQVWMAENLQTKFFRNGDPIPQANTKEEWYNATKYKTPIWCYFDFDPANEKMGLFYNGYVIIDSRRIAPKNWHIPSRNDWKILASHLEKTSKSVDYEHKLKSTTSWNNYFDKKNGTNETGFNALPTGSIGWKGEMTGSNKPNYCEWWSSSRVIGNKHCDNHLFSPRLAFTEKGLVTNAVANLNNGACIRLIKD